MKQEIKKFKIQGEKSIILDEEESRSIDNLGKTGWNYSLTNSEGEDLLSVSWDTDSENKQFYTVCEKSEDDKIFYESEDAQRVVEIKEVYYDNEPQSHSAFDFESNFISELDKISNSEIDYSFNNQEEWSNYNAPRKLTAYPVGTVEVSQDKVEDFEILCEKHNIDFEVVEE